MRLNHKTIVQHICNKYKLTEKKDGNFTRFYPIADSNHNIGFIEKIPAGRYLKTVYIQFFDYEDNDKNKKIENEILKLYEEQRNGMNPERAGTTQNRNIIF